MFYAYERLSKISPRFTIAAASFGNVHGVYKPGNVKLTPSILDASQKIRFREVRSAGQVPGLRVPRVAQVSTLEEIRESISYGVVKMNIDTDTQWATWEGLLNYIRPTVAYLQGQLATRKAPTSRTSSTIARMAACRSDFHDRPSGKAFSDLNAINVL